MCTGLTKGGTTQQYQVPAGRSLHGSHVKQTDIGSVGKALILNFVEIVSYEYLLEMRMCQSDHWYPCCSMIFEDEQGIMSILKISVRTSTEKLYYLQCLMHSESEYIPH